MQSENHPRCTVMQSRAVTFLLTKLRQRDLPTDQFQIIGDRLMRLLGEEALARLPTVVEGEVETPCGVAKGYVSTPGPPVCIVSIVREGLKKKHTTNLGFWLKLGGGRGQSGFQEPNLLLVII